MNTWTDYDDLERRAADREFRAKLPAAATPDRIASARAFIDTLPGIPPGGLDEAIRAAAWAEGQRKTAEDMAALWRAKAAHRARECDELDELRFHRDCWRAFGLAFSGLMLAAALVVWMLWRWM